MKKMTILAILALFFVSQPFGVLADPGFLDKEEEAEVPQTVYPCPKTLITDNSKCMDCHKLVATPQGGVEFGFEEISVLDNYTAKPYGLELTYDGKMITPYIEWTDISPGSSSGLRAAMDYIKWHPEFSKTIVIEINSFGGSLFDAWRMVGIMDQYKEQGYIFQTQCMGKAMSAGFVLFANGNKGHRFVNPRAEFMWHELWSFEFFKINTPSKKEHEAEVFRHLQDNIHEWLAERSNMEKDEMDAFVEFKEYWVNGQEMLEVGFADAPLGVSK